jgi:hypothetical protein
MRVDQDGAESRTTTWTWDTAVTYEVKALSLMP